jgi:hypothetical protein
VALTRVAQAEALAGVKSAAVVIGSRRTGAAARRGLLAKKAAATPNDHHRDPRARRATQRRRARGRPTLLSETQVVASTESLPRAGSEDSG